MSARRLNVSVPDGLAAQARSFSLPISAICQEALKQAVAKAAQEKGCPLCGAGGVET